MANTGPGKSITITIEGLWKSYGDNVVLRGIDLEIPAGETLVIIGGSGEGKSVLIRQIIGLEEPERGRVRLDGMTVQEYTALPFNEKPFRMSMVFQSSALLNSLTVGENIGLSLREHRLKDPAEIGRIVRTVLSQVDMEGTETKLPAELSGGMRKRVAIARALAVDSQVILYDEPTAELDPILNEQIGGLIQKIQNERAPTQVVVTHNLPLARQVADHVAVMRDGEVVDYRTGEEFTRSDHPHTRNFLRASQVVET